MGYSEAGMQGIKQNGRKWRKTIHGLPDVLDEIGMAKDSEDAEAINAGLRKVHALFAPHFERGEAYGSEVGALEWFEDESAAYEVEMGVLHEWVQEFDFRLGELYDFADFNRIWIEPRTPAPTEGETP